MGEPGAVPHTDAPIPGGDPDPPIPGLHNAADVVAGKAFLFRKMGKTGAIPDADATAPGADPDPAVPGLHQASYHAMAEASGFREMHEAGAIPHADATAPGAGPDLTIPGLYQASDHIGAHAVFGIQVSEMKARIPAIVRLRRAPFRPGGRHAFTFGGNVWWGRNRRHVYGLAVTR